VTFVVEKEGQISEVKVLRNLYPSLDKEALRVVKSMPNWKPGMQNGKPVRVKYNLPVFFQLK
jgi:protein TonB